LIVLRFFGQPKHYPVKCGSDGNLACKSRVIARLNRKLEQRGFVFIGCLEPRLPLGIDVNVAGCTSTYAAAFRVYSSNVVSHRGFHHGPTLFGFDALDFSVSFPEYN